MRWLREEGGAGGSIEITAEDVYSKRCSYRGITLLYIIKRQSAYRFEPESQRHPCFECRMVVSSRRILARGIQTIQTMGIAVTRVYRLPFCMMYEQCDTVLKAALQIWRFCYRSFVKASSAVQILFTNL